MKNGANSDSLKVPSHLSRRSRVWAKAILAKYVLEEHHHALLVAAAEALDRGEEARRRAQRDGAFIRNRFGVLVAHPALAVERQSKITFARLVRELGLDGDEPEAPRAAALKGWATRRGMKA